MRGQWAYDDQLQDVFNIRAYQHLLNLDNGFRFYITVKQLQPLIFTEFKHGYD